jgi:putative membrane protein
MKKFIPLILAAAIASTGAIVPAAVAQPGMARGASVAYVAKAGAADLYEIQSSQTAMRRTRDARVREFARMLVDDHRRSTEQVAAAAREAGLHPRPPMLEPAQRQMLRQLERATARQFDRLYLRQQISAHQQALGLHQRYARNGDAPPLRRAAAGIVPVVEGHLAQARRLAR